MNNTATRTLKKIADLLELSWKNDLRLVFWEKNCDNLKT